MAFGLSFGKNKSKTDQTKTVNSTESRSETGASQTEASKSSTANTQQTSSQQQTQTGTQTGTSNTTGTGQTSQIQESIRQLFSDQTLGQLDQLTQGLLTQQGAANAELNAFDKDAFIAGGLGRAESRVESQLDEALGSMFSAIGGTSGTNSAAALLEQRMQTQAADELAGVESQLTATAEEIGRTNTATGNQFLDSILGSLRGGIESTSGTAATTEQTAQQQQQQQQSATSTESTSQQQQTQQVVETMMEAVIKALTGTSTTQGTETLKGTTTEKGSGFGLSI